MSKLRALIIYYSQVGQTKKAVENYAKSIQEKYEIDYFDLKDCVQDFSFPWKMTKFFRVFPKCITNDAKAIERIPEKFLKTEYDLIVIGYQVWFLSAALPIQSAFKNPDFSKLIKDKNVQCIITARNMWISAVSKVNKVLKSFSPRSINNIILCDTSPGWATFVTTPRWMLTGKKEAFWFFPEAGINKEDFQALAQKRLAAHSAPHLRTALYIQEVIGHQLFLFWGKIISFLTNKDGFFRDFLLVFFRINLFMAIVFLLPLTELILLFTEKLFKGHLENKIKRTLTFERS